jgi:hypothetical protein
MIDINSRQQASTWPGCWWRDTETVALIWGGRAELSRVTGMAARSGATVSNPDGERDGSGDGKRSGGRDAERPRVRGG